MEAIGPESIWEATNEGINQDVCKTPEMPGCARYYIAPRNCECRFVPAYFLAVIPGITPACGQYRRGCTAPRRGRFLDIRYRLSTLTPSAALIMQRPAESFRDSM